MCHLRVNGRLPESSLEVPEDRGDGLHLGGGEDVRRPGGGGGAHPRSAVSHYSSAHNQILEILFFLIIFKYF